MVGLLTCVIYVLINVLFNVLFMYYLMYYIVQSAINCKPCQKKVIEASYIFSDSSSQYSIRVRLLADSYQNWQVSCDFKNSKNQMIFRTPFLSFGSKITNLSELIDELWAKTVRHDCRRYMLTVSRKRNQN